MGGIVNGLTLSKLKAYGASFLIFTDYMRPSIRLAALMEIPSIFIMTHDSIGLGEDGPTHQPVENYATLRAVPNLDFIRPADANEVSVLWKYIIDLKDRPVVLALSRQDLPVFDRTKYSSEYGALKGAYIMADSCWHSFATSASGMTSKITDSEKSTAQCKNDLPEVILIGTGSELQLCLQAFDELNKNGIKARVVSMPCWSLFEQQSVEYKESVLPSKVKLRIAVEAGSEFGWSKYIGEGSFIGLHSFGASLLIKSYIKSLA